MKKPKLIKRSGNLFDQHPYSLPGHLVTTRGWLPFLPGAEVIQELDTRIPNGVIQRAPGLAFPFALKPAEPPTEEEEVRIVKSSNETAHLMDSDDVVYLSSLAHRALGCLAGMARSGNGRALWHFADLLNQGVEGLSQMMWANVKAFRPYARKQIRWPLMKSQHPHNCDPDSRLEEVELGADVQMQFDKYSKWKVDFAANYAIGLYRHLEELRGDDRQILVNGKPLREILPPFEKSTADKWWRIAKVCLLHTYSKPERLPEFTKIVTAATKRKSPGRMRQAILEKIKARFIALAK